MKSEILTLLREAEGYLSGQELCTRFGVSRTAVWKAIKQLEKEGYTIEAVQNKGYRLTAIPDTLSVSELKSRLHTAWVGSDIYFYESTDSTNLQAKRLAEHKASHGTLVVAEAQTQGRGRRGRDWESPAVGNLYFTLLLRPELEPGKASMLTLIMALAVAKGLRVLTAGDALIKWPNDIVLGGKKVAGILTEMTMEADFIQHIVIGVGINVAKQEFPSALVHTATALETELQDRVPRALLLETILGFFEQEYDIFLKDGNLSGLQEEYEKFLVNRGREVRVLDPKGEFTGVARGINEQGELLVELPTGELQPIYAGEVSVRGIYGYV